MGRKKTHEEYVGELAVKNPYIKVVGMYIDSKTPIEHYCEKHNISWNIAPHNALEGKGCKECKSEKIKNKRRKTHDEYVQELLMYNPNIKVLGKYITSKIPITHHCTKHNISWDVSPVSVLLCGGCPTCHYEKVGEKLRKTHDEYVIEVSMVNSNIEVL